MNCGRGPTRPGFAKSRIAHRSPRPFSIGVPVSAIRVRAGMRRSCCDVSFAGFLIACASSRIDLRPRHRRDRVDVAHRGAVGRDDDVGVRDLGRDLVGRGAVRAVMHDDAQTRGEARRFGGPVPDDGGRRDHERGPGPGAGEEVGEHRRRLAETHVEREATAEPGLVEEAEPRQRFGLVAAELADETVRRRGRRRRDVGRGLEQLGRPTATDDRHAARERRTFDAEREAQRLRAGELGGVGPFRERVGRGLQIGLVERDPTPTRPDERPRFARQPRDVGRGELDVVEHRRPAHVGELVRADRRLLRASTNTRNDGVGLRRDNAGTRTSKPAASSCGPVWP